MMANFSSHRVKEIMGWTFKVLRGKKKKKKKKKKKPPKTKKKKVSDDVQKRDPRTPLVGM